MTYTLRVKDSFSAAHRLTGAGGKCENLHGHNFAVELVVRGRRLDGAGMLMDFTELSAILARILDRLDHRDLNLHPDLGEVPSSERIAGWVFARAEEALAGREAEVAAVTVAESEKASATFERG